jgi:hypothetical protein
MEGLGQSENPITSLGIEPVTFQLVAEYLNQLHPHTIFFLCFHIAVMMTMCTFVF